MGNSKTHLGRPPARPPKNMLFCWAQAQIWAHGPSVTALGDITGSPIRWMPNQIHGTVSMDTVPWIWFGIHRIGEPVMSPRAVTLGPWAQIWAWAQQNNIFLGGRAGGLPKWVLEFPMKCHHKMIPSQIHFFRDPFLTPKRSPGQNVDPGSKKSIPGSKIGPWA